MTASTGWLLRCASSAPVSVASSLCACRFGKRCALTTAFAASPLTSARCTWYEPDSASRPEMSAPILPAPRMRTLGMRDLQKRGGILASPAGCYAPFMTRNPDLIQWHPASWQSKPAQQQAAYADTAALQRTVASLARLPPLVVSWEIEALRDHIAAAQRGERFILQGGDCAETFEDCESDKIAKKLKILLQMSLVLVYGLRKPVVRIGRMAGQYAKPRSADTETRDDVTLPSYRGDIVNRPGFTPDERDPDPELLLRGYERAALTLNFVRALIDGGFADLHHPEYWDLDFVRHSPLKDAYERIVQSISDSLDFFEATSRAPIHEANRVAFYTSHEGLHLPYE